MLSPSSQIHKIISLILKIITKICGDKSSSNPSGRIASRTRIMLLPLFKTYYRFFHWLCVVGITKKWDGSNRWPGYSCWPFDSDAWLNRQLVMGPIDEPFSRLTAADPDMVTYPVSFLNPLVISVDDALAESNCARPSGERQPGGGLASRGEREWLLG